MRDMGEFMTWQLRAFEILKEVYGLSPTDLTGNPNFLLMDFLDGKEPSDSIRQWYEREFGEYTLVASDKNKQIKHTVIDD